MSQRAREAVRLTLKKDFGRRRQRVVKSPDGLKVLKWRARVRALALRLRPINCLALIVAMALLFTAETQQALGMVVICGLLGWGLEVGAAAPRTRRPPRIRRDVRPLLAKRVVVVPQQRRAGRIVRARPSPIVLGLPPSRPRARVVERRPGTYVEEME